MAGTDPFAGAMLEDLVAKYLDSVLGVEDL